MEASVTRSYLNIGITLCLVVLAASLRILPHPDNFAPVMAVAIFGGAFLPRRWAMVVPLLVMMVSDAIIGWHDLVPVTWGLYAAIALASNLLLYRPAFARTALLTLGSSLVFFVVTNLAVWATSGMYAHTWTGLGQCFTLALPFFRNSLMGDLFYTGVLFGAYALAVRITMNTRTVSRA